MATDFPRVASYFDAGELGPPWPDLVPFIEALRQSTGLPVDAPTYASNARENRRVAAATEAAAQSVYGFPLSVQDPRAALHVFMLQRPRRACAAALLRARRAQRDGS